MRGLMEWNQGLFQIFLPAESLPEVTTSFFIDASVLSYDKTSKHHLEQMMERQGLSKDKRDALIELMVLMSRLQEQRLQLEDQQLYSHGPKLASMQKKLSRIRALQTMFDEACFKSGGRGLLGYAKRLFGNESWSEWFSSRTDLGELILLVLDYTDGLSTTKASLRLGRLNLNQAGDEAHKIISTLEGMEVWDILTYDDEIGHRQLADDAAETLSFVKTVSPPGTGGATQYGYSYSYDYSMDATSDGGFAFITSDYTISTFSYFWAVKLNGAGEVIWGRALTGTHSDEGRAIKELYNGDFILVGNTNSYGSSEWAIAAIKLGIDGDMQWAQWITVSGAQLLVHAVDVSSDGCYGIIGTISSFGGLSEQVLAIKLDSTGNTIWARAVGGESTNVGYALSITSNDDFVVAGYTSSFDAGSYDVLVTKISNDGDMLWARTLGQGYGYAIITTSDNGVVVTGSVEGFVDGKYIQVLVAKLNAVGDIVWASAVGGEIGGTNIGRSVTETAEGDFIVTGYTQSFGAGSYDALVLKLNASGSLKWARTLGGISKDYAYAAGTLVNGELVFVGETHSFSISGSKDHDILLAKLDSNGWIANCSFIQAIDPTVVDISTNLTVQNLSSINFLDITANLTTESGKISVTDVTSSLQNEGRCANAIPASKIEVTSMAPQEDSMPVEDWVIGVSCGVIALGIIVGVTIGIVRKERAMVANKRKLSMPFIEMGFPTDQVRTVAIDPQPAWLRVWGGKYTPEGQTPEYRPMGNKEAGCAVGFIVQTAKGRRYVAKFGFPDDSQILPQAMATRSKALQHTVLSVIMEKIAADVYATLGQDFYYVPKHRLARLKTRNAFTKRNVLSVHLMESINRDRRDSEEIEEGVHLLSRWMDFYVDIVNLSECFLDKGTEIGCPFMTCLEKGYAPEFARIEGEVVPILGLMEILASSRLLADTDVLGGGGRNAGYVIERDHDGTPVAVRMVKIDAGESFNFSSDCNQLIQSFNPVSTALKLENKKDIQFGNQQPLVIKWSGLIKRQKVAFLAALRRGLNFLSKASVVDFILQRQGQFNKVFENRELLSPDVILAFKKNWQACWDLQFQSEVYGELLVEKSESLRSSSVPFNPKPHGAVTLRMEEAESLALTEEAHNF